MPPPQTPPPGELPPQYQYQRPAYQPAPPALAPNGQPLANFGDRFLAYLIDYAIYLAISLVWTVPFMIWWIIAFFDRIVEIQPTFDPDGEPVPPDFNDILVLYIPMLIFVVASIALGLIYTYLYWVEYQLRKGGQTIGKRAMNIRVIPVDPAASGLTRGDFAVRWLVQWVVGMFISLFSLLDGLWQLWDKPLQQCLHDKAAKTVVVKVG
ncbi:MAG TPA: RDD family protein [Candidatus Limnocylindrales bacterium]